MKSKVISLLSLVLFLMSPGASWCENSDASQDVVFVSQPGQRGVYLKTTGKILHLTANEIIMQTGDGKHVLYTREVVRRVSLNSTHPPDRQELVKIYWNKEESRIVQVVQSTPFIGPYFSFLKDLSPAARTFLALLVLLALLLYAAYKIYEMFVVTTNLRTLNAMKLNMEVRKLRYEVQGIEKQLGITARVAVDETAEKEIDKEFVPYRFEIPRVHIWDFLKYKVFRMLTAEDKQRRKDSWHKKWQDYKGKAVWLPKLVYCFRWLLNVIVTILMTIFSLGALFNIILPFTMPEAYYGESPLISLIFIPVFVVSFAYLLRLNAQRRIISETYHEASTKRG